MLETTLEKETLLPILEAILLASGRPMSLSEFRTLLCETKNPPTDSLLKSALADLAQTYACESRGIELKEVASGYQFQVKPQYAPWIGKLWAEKPPRYSKALLETLALIAYRQPITRGEIEAIRGVSVGSSIFKILHEEREWIRVVGHKEVPGKPSLYGTTKAFLDYFGLKDLKSLPNLSDILSNEPC